MSQSESSLDAIKPAPPRHVPAIHRHSNEAEATYSYTQSAGGHLEYEEFFSYADQLYRIVEKRAENAGSWVRELKQFVEQHQKGNVDWKSTLGNIERAGQRIARGEYLVTYRGEFNSEFAPRKIVALPRSTLGPLAESLRPKRVLPYFMSDYVFKQKQGESLTKGEYKDATSRIAVHYSFYHLGGSGDMVLKGLSVKRSEDADQWCQDVYRLYKKRRGASLVIDWMQLNEDCKKLRWNLLVTAAYACSGQLPTAQRVVDGDYDGILASPGNVSQPGEGFVRPAASHSLARISRRYARLVGYNGTEAQQGELELI